MRYKSFLISLFLSLFLFSCATEITQTQVTTQDIKTEQQSPKTSFNRVVALSSLAADIISQLDQTKLVGIVGSQLLKDDGKFKDIPRVSAEQNPPNLEKIVALKPDLVIGVAGFSNVPLQKLKQLGIETLSTKVYSWEALEELTKNIAEKISADPQPLLNRYKAFLPKKQNPENQKLSTLVLVSTK
jgi:iron complex transport system substrate-binding protein